MREALVGDGEGEKVDDAPEDDTNGAEGDGARGEGVDRGGNRRRHGANDAEDEVWKNQCFEVRGHEQVEGAEVVGESGIRCPPV